MAFQATKTQPNGSVSQVHQVVQVSVSDGAALAVVHSFASEDAMRATPALLNWQEVYPMPLPAVLDAQAWLIGVDGPFAGGAVLQKVTDVDQKRADLVRRVTAKRWEVETGGITCPGGIRVLTGRTDQDRITSVIVNAGAAGIEAVDFKADSGWVQLTLEEVQGIARAVALHVQACFSAERTHHEAIAALATEVEIDAYDVTAGWPSSTTEQE